ncbi:M48 family metalloprotease [Azospirillum melinis]|uniref:M48 family metalloprotease n=1 Tax=Azospirillum melinis TaxID=328839 RepID=A0ABX2KK00_9PROT|nr:zinc metalloprotease HtpX [Azospirillum melinis]MBP2309986.1 heat shock protein HtpX [Azospirillum melinis]NUB02761.1 M48 family metalloprotease [Azospirillum melinis]
MHALHLNEQELRRHKLRNVVQSILLVGGLTLLAAAIGWLLLGPAGILWVIILIGMAVAFSPSISPQVILGLYGARRLRRSELPEVQDALAALARWAGLHNIPGLHYLPTPVPNAFAVGSASRSAIVLTDGLLRAMNLRELVGVLAHEVSHVRNHDLFIMGLADIISRVTGAMATTGIVLLFLTLPSMLAEQEGVPWLLIALLLGAPTVNTLIQLTLSRTREFDADLDAAAISGDPAGLASALAKLQRYDPGFWERMLFPGRRNPHPSVLRTHPATEERIERLLALRQVESLRPAFETRSIALPGHLAPPAHRPRWRASGLWH